MHAKDSTRPCWGSLTETEQAQWHDQLPALVQAYNNTIHSTTGMTPHYVVFGRHARLPVDWVIGLKPGAGLHTLLGWVKGHQNALSHAYQTVQTQTQHRQELDQARYNRRARLAPLLQGERVLVRNFRRRAKGKLNLKWTPEPFVVVRQLQEGHPVYVLRPEGKEAPTRTVHRNNLRPCPLNVLQDSQAVERPEPTVIDPMEGLPPPTWWLPRLLSGNQPPVGNIGDPALVPPPDPLVEPAAPPSDLNQSDLRRSQLANLGVPPVRYR